MRIGYLHPKQITGADNCWATKYCTFSQNFRFPSPQSHKLNSYSKKHPQPSTMATQLPPPKRQRSAYAQSQMPKVEEPAKDIPSIVVQFKSAEDGSSLGPAINLPADTARDALQMLVNKLRGEVSV